MTALLAMADYNGTLAAVRSLGRAGVPVVIADSNRLAPARWSRWVVRTLAAPDVGQPAKFLEWLLEVGGRAPGTVLHATSDETAFLFSRHRTELARHFRVAVADFDAIWSLLDKWRLYELCTELGIDAPRTWLNPSDDVRFPLVVKPRTQAFLTPHQKGRIVRGPDALAGACDDLRRSTHHDRIVLDREPHASEPILQELGRHEGIYNLSGFMDTTGELFVVQASRKLLQWPRLLGVGLCFEECAVDPELARGVERLCRRVGYHGAFEVEFVENEGRHLLIDFNPRFYGQMAFDIGRGLDLPLLVHLDALGKRDALRDAFERAREKTARVHDRVFCNRIELEMVLGLSRLAGTSKRADTVRWHGWLDAHREDRVDAVLDRDDWAPGAVDAVSTFWRFAAHPRSAWRGARTG